MKSRFVRFSIVLLLFAALAAAQPTNANPQLIELGTLGGDDSMAWDINNRGQVVGGSTTTLGDQHAFLWDKGKMIDLVGEVEGFHSAATFISDSGKITGMIMLPQYPPFETAFLWENGRMTILEGLGGDYTSSTGINNRGQVIGISTTPQGERHALLWDSGSTINLSLPGDQSSHPHAINEAGTVLVESGQMRSYLWHNGQITDLGTLGGCCTIARALSNSGAAAGLSETASGEYHLFTWKNGKMTDLGKPEGALVLNSVADMNNSGQIVVNGIDLSGTPQVFLWSKGSFTQLEDWYGIEAYAHEINEKGQVIGSVQVSLETGATYAAFWDSKGRLSILGTLGGRFSVATGLNARGQVSGYGSREIVGLRAFIWNEK
jgi:probable HAF family extracellular repeat protein